MQWKNSCGTQFCSSGKSFLFGLVNAIVGLVKAAGRKRTEPGIDGWSSRGEARRGAAVVAESRPSIYHRHGIAMAYVPYYSMASFLASRRVVHRKVRSSAACASIHPPSVQHAGVARQFFSAVYSSVSCPKLLSSQFSIGKLFNYVSK